MEINEDLDKTLRRLRNIDQVISGLLDLNRAPVVVEKKLNQLEDLIANIPLANNDLVDEWTDRLVALWTRFHSDHGTKEKTTVLAANETQSESRPRRCSYSNDIRCNSSANSYSPKRCPRSASREIRSPRRRNLRILDRRFDHVANNRNYTANFVAQDKLRKNKFFEHNAMQRPMSAPQKYEFANDDSVSMAGDSGQMNDGLFDWSTLDEEDKPQVMPSKMSTKQFPSEPRQARSINRKFPTRPKHSIQKENQMPVDNLGLKAFALPKEVIYSSMKKAILKLSKIPSCNNVDYALSLEHLLKIVTNVDYLIGAHFHDEQFQSDLLKIAFDVLPDDLAVQFREKRQTVRNLKRFLHKVLVKHFTEQGDMHKVEQFCSPSNEFCYYCMVTGHDSLNCPELADTINFHSNLSTKQRSPSSDNVKKCYECDQAGHIARDCPVTHKLCYICSQGGHIARDCHQRHENEPQLNKEINKEELNKEENKPMVGAVNLLHDHQSFTSERALNEQMHKLTLLGNALELQLLTNSMAIETIPMSILEKNLFHLEQSIRSIPSSHPKFINQWNAKLTHIKKKFAESNALCNSISNNFDINEGGDNLQQESEVECTKKSLPCSNQSDSVEQQQQQVSHQLKQLNNCIEIMLTSKVVSIEELDSKIAQLVEATGNIPAEFVELSDHWCDIVAKVMQRYGMMVNGKIDN